MTIKILFKSGKEKIYIDADSMIYRGDIMHLRIYREVNYPQHHTQTYELNILDIEKIEVLAYQ